MQHGQRAVPHVLLDNSRGRRGQLKPSGNPATRRWLSPAAAPEPTRWLRDWVSAPGAPADHGGRTVHPVAGRRVSFVPEVPPTASTLENDANSLGKDFTLAEGKDARKASLAFCMNRNEFPQKAIKAVLEAGQHGVN